MAIGTPTHTQLFYGYLNFVRDNPGESVPEETFTHSNLSWSSMIPYLISPSITFHGILCSIYMPDSVFPQPLSKFSLVYLLPDTFHFILAFLHPIIVFFSQ